MVKKSLVWPSGLNSQVAELVEAKNYRNQSEIITPVSKEAREI
jgi:Arc/MetJ-type ribon-helix-helix transcriptional regulator